MARHSKMNSVSSMASSGLESIRDGTASTVSLAMTGVSSNVTSEGGSGGLNDAFRASRDWKLREASISNLESQQRRLQQELALLGPKQQQARSKERLKGRSPALGPDGLPRSGWEVRPMEERYRLLKKLKGGAMAIVYLAEDRSTTAFYHEVVLKVLSAGATFEQRQRMIREVSLVGAVRHPNVVKYQDAAEAPDGALFIAMDVIHGRDLQQVIDKNKRLHPVYVVEVVSGVLKGLKALHEKLIVHRDLKPANVIVSPETGHVKIIDLGLAKHLETESILTGDNVVGTPMYFAPEQTRSGTAVSTNLDLWAVGVMIFHCTTGTLPFARLGDSLEVIVHEIRTKEARRLAETYSSVCQAPPPSQLPYLQAVVDKALVKDATKRVQTASEMLSLLASVPMQSTPAVQTPLSSPAEAGKGWGREERDDGARQAVAAAEAAAAAAAEEADRARITLTKTRQDLATAEGNRAEQQSEINELNKQVADLRLALEAKESESKERIDVEAARDRQADGVTRNTAALSEAIQQEVTGTGQQLEESNIKLTRKVRMFESRAIEAEKEIQELRQQLQREREQQTSQAGQGGSVNPDNNSDLDRVYEELADKEIETEDLKEQLKNLRATAQQQLADAANELSSMRSRLTKEQARVSQLQVSMKESSLHDTSAAARGSHSWKADSSDGPGQVYEMQADNTLALVPVASKKKGGRHGDGGEAGGGLEVVVSSKKPSRDSAAAKSLHANEEDGEEDAVDLDLDRQLDRLQYQVLFLLCAWHGRTAIAPGLLSRRAANSCALTLWLLPTPEIQSRSGNRPLAWRGLLCARLDDGKREGDEYPHARDGVERCRTAQHAHRQAHQVWSVFFYPLALFAEW